LIRPAAFISAGDTVAIDAGVSHAGHSDIAVRAGLSGEF
jgi:hypothetical protein